MDPASTLDLTLWGDRLVSGLVTEIQGWPVTAAGVTLILEHPPFSEAFSLCTHGRHLSKRCTPALPPWIQGCTTPLQRWGKTHPGVLLPQVWSTDQRHQHEPLWEPPCQCPRLVSHWLRVGARGQPSQQGLWETLGASRGDKGGAISVSYRRRFKERQNHDSALSRHSRAGLWYDVFAYPFIHSFIHSWRLYHPTTFPACCHFYSPKAQAGE